MAVHEVRELHEFDTEVFTDVVEVEVRVGRHTSGVFVTLTDGSRVLIKSRTDTARSVVSPIRVEIEEMPA